MMSKKLMCVFAHPDDESLGMGGALAKYAAEGVEVALVTATRGERGWSGPREAYPGAEGLGRLREAELRCAAEVLGIKDLTFLGYMDGEVDQASPGEIIPRIAREICRFKPQVLVTFGPEGAYGHPDHIAISQFSCGGAQLATSQGWQVSKLYYAVNSLEVEALINQFVGGVHFSVDGKLREFTGWKDWMITTRIDASAYWQTAWQGIQCHQTQLPGMAGLQQMTPEQHQAAWGTGTFYRAYSLVNSGHQVETDLFEGI